MAEEPKRQFKVEVVEGPDHGDLCELEQTTFYRVVDTHSNAVVLAFEGEMEARLDGGIWSDYRYYGVCEVIVAPDGRSVRVKYHGGHEETVPLPK